MLRHNETRCDAEGVPCVVQQVWMKSNHTVNAKLFTGRLNSVPLPAVLGPVDRELLGFNYWPAGSSTTDWEAYDLTMADVMDRLEKTAYQVWKDV